jgi:hypothetical protein
MVGAERVRWARNTDRSAVADVSDCPSMTGRGARSNPTKRVNMDREERLGEIAYK